MDKPIYTPLKVNNEIELCEISDLDCKQMIEKRLSRVEMERSHKKNYDFVLECDDICETTNQVENFIGKDTFK